MSRCLRLFKFNRRFPSGFFGVVLLYTLSCFCQDVPWIRDYGVGMRYAGKTNRPVLVDFWSRWCIPCSRMDREVYTSPGFLEASRDFVLIRVDADEESDTVARFGVKTLPTRLFLDPQGKILRPSTGLTNTGTLVEIMRSILSSLEPSTDSPLRVDASDEIEKRADSPSKPVEIIPNRTSATLPTTGGAHIQPPSIIDLSNADLLNKCPRELKGVTLNENQRAVDPFLEKIGHKVNEFFENLPNTVSKEQIRQQRLGWDGRVEDQVDQDVHYLLLLQSKDTGRDWEEARTDEKGRPVKLTRLNGDSFLTSGFAMQCILFSPLRLGASRFRYLGKQSSKPYAHLIAFAQKPGTAIPGLFRMKGVSANALTQGIAWVDPENYQIIRIRSDLLGPLKGTGLTQLTSEIFYAEHQFPSSPHSFWLPAEVVVTIKYRGTFYRNTHRYSDYRLFSVQSFEKREPIPHPGPF